MQKITGPMTYGRKTVGTTAVSLLATRPALVRGLIVKAMSTNTVAVFVGQSGVTTSSGYQLTAGQSVQVPIYDGTLVYAISGSANQGVCFIGA